MSEPGRYATVGSLAAALRGATAEIREIESDVSAFIASLFPGWKPLFPARRGWIFVAPDILGIYSIDSSPAAIAALHLAGFRRITLHDHRWGERCDCIPRIDPSTPDVTQAGKVTEGHPGDRPPSRPKKTDG